MALSSDLVSQFAKVTDDSKVTHKENRLRGTIVADGGTLCVKLDGSDVMTPVAKVDDATGKMATTNSNGDPIINDTTVGLSEGDRVEVEIKNHSAVVTGNLTNPAFGVMEADGFRSEINQKANEIFAKVETLAGDLSAEINLTADELRTEVRNTVDGLSTVITQNANSIESLVEKDDEFTKFIQDVNKFEFMGKGGSVKIQGGSINLTGAITFSQLDSDAQQKINDAQSTAISAKNDASSARTAANNAQVAADDAKSIAYDAAGEAANARIAADGAVSVFEGFLVKGTDSTGLLLKTYIDGSKISANSIYSNMLHLGGLLTVYDNVESSVVGGYLGYNPGYNSTYGIGIWSSLTGPQVVCSNQAARLSYGTYASVVTDSDAVILDGLVSIEFEISGSAKVVVDSSYFRPYYNYNTSKYVDMYLGSSMAPWSAVYASTGAVYTSDRNQKNSIEDLPEKYLEMFDLLQPKRFKLNNGTSDRYHIGYIAQEVEDAMASTGIDSREFGGLVKDKDENGNDVYMLRYDEFDAIRDAKIKRLETENNDLKTRVETLEKLVAQLLEER